MIEIVSIIVACRNEMGMVVRFLRSLESQNGFDYELELIFADGQSADGTFETLQKFAAAKRNARVISNPARIASAGLNAAIRASRGSIILRMDAHTEYAPDYVRECLRTLRTTGADVVGGPALTAPETTWQRAVALAYRSPLFAGGSRVFDASYEGPVDTVAYGCWHRDILERAGLFDPGMVRNQDDDLSLRIRQIGGRIWQSKSIRSWYQPRRTLTALTRQYFEYGYWKVYGMRKHGGPARLRHLAPGGFAATLAILAITRPRVFAWVFLGYFGLVLAEDVNVATEGIEIALAPIAALATIAAHLGYGAGTIIGALRFLTRPLFIQFKRREA